MLWTIAALLGIGGCASGVLDVGYHPATAPNPPPRALAQARRVVIRPVLDRRLDDTRVGSASKNGEAMVSRRPVADIVRDALAVELTRAGYSMVAERGDVVLAPEVEEFWIDVVSGYKTTLYVGRVVIALAVIDGASGERVLARRYVAISRREGDEDPKRVARDALEVALARALHDLATDPTIPAALGSRSDPPARSQHHPVRFDS
jgi:uncharacterized lipoprotein YajG